MNNIEKDTYRYEVFEALNQCILYYTFDLEWSIFPGSCPFYSV